LPGYGCGAFKKFNALVVRLLFGVALVEDLVNVIASAVNLLNVLLDDFLRMVGGDLSLLCGDLSLFRIGLGAKCIQFSPFGLRLRLANLLSRWAASTGPKQDRRYSADECR
jgi:hypothetical protein